MIVPKSTIPNWKKEFAKWTPNLKLVHLEPTQEKRDECLAEMFKTDNMDVCLTTYDALQRVPSLRNHFKWHLVVFDEAHKLKNSDSVTVNLSR